MGRMRVVVVKVRWVVGKDDLAFKHLNLTFYELYKFEMVDCVESNIWKISQNQVPIPQDISCGLDVSLQISCFRPLRTCIDRARKDATIDGMATFGKTVNCPACSEGLVIRVSDNQKYIHNIFESMGNSNLNCEGCTQFYAPVVNLKLNNLR